MKSYKVLISFHYSCVTFLRRVFILKRKWNVVLITVKKFLFPSALFCACTNVMIFHLRSQVDINSFVTQWQRRNSDRILMCDVRCFWCSFIIFKHDSIQPMIFKNFFNEKLFNLFLSSKRCGRGEMKKVDKFIKWLKYFYSFRLAPTVSKLESHLLIVNLKFSFYSRCFRKPPRNTVSLEKWKEKKCSARDPLSKIIQHLTPSWFFTFLSGTSWKCETRTRKNIFVMYEASKFTQNEYETN